MASVLGARAFHATTIRLGLARAQAGVGHLLDASDTYGRIVSEGPGASPSPALVKAVADAKRELAALAPRVPALVVTLNGPASAALTLDGSPLPRSAMGSKQPVDPGKHMLHAAAPGFLPADLSVTVAEGQSLPVTLELRPDGDAAQGPAPVAAPASGGAWPVTKTTGVALMGVGGLGVVIGGVLLGVAKSKYDDLSAACPGHAGCAPSLSGELSSYHATGGAAIGSLILGGLALATGIALFVTAPKRASPPTGRFVTPTLGVGHAGLAGAF